MLKFYFTTVIVWSVILYASLEITVNKIIENGWADVDVDILNAGRKALLGPWYLYSLFIAMVPVIRAIVAISYWYMFVVKKEDAERSGDI